MYKGDYRDLEGPFKSRWHKVCFAPALCLPCNPILTPLRRLVSKKKNRFEKEGFSLDLVYITDRIICHGFPAAGVEHLYRNPRSEVARFLETKHAGHYKVFNFCCEPGRGYDPAVFDGQVERYPFRDHGVPPLATMAEFCNSAKAWLDADEKNVVTLHCKAGKGRAGIMTCCLLVRLGFKETALQAMEYYDIMRVKNKRGLTVTSQRKWVALYERLWREIWELPAASSIGNFPSEEYPGERYPLPEPKERHLSSVEIMEIPEYLDSAGFFIKVFLGTTTTRFEFEDLWKSDVEHLGGSETKKNDPAKPSQVGWTERNSEGRGIKAGNKDFAVNCIVKGNFCVQVFAVTPGLLGKKKKKLCELWNNTLMMSQGSEGEIIDFPTSELNIKKKMKKKIDGITVRLGFGQAGKVREPSESGIEMQQLITRTAPAFSTHL
ncbi:hypothetical protein TrVE_jg6552 [Triparma verrucosa]|uniref:Phosphatidylinositol-3,4,5-trisphosphate 3-phosphatase n=1 Tax=Triparma verrucosa TaxID=1606542 RepID=A0A9W7C164_9STRA|nr:hypothetical protein TrVE_jg6552 [Triparma verrucosa]